MNKTVVITHTVWAAAVAGAFFVGEALKPGTSGTTSVASSESTSATQATKAGVRSAREISKPPVNATDFASEMASVMAETDEALRINRANRLLKGLTPDVLEGLNPGMVPDTLQLFQDVRFTAGASLKTLEAYGDFMTAWARVDPQGAARHMVDPKNSYYVWPSHPGGNFAYMLGDMKRDRRAAVIAEWARTDLAGAKQFAAGIDEKYRRRDMTMGVMKHLATTDLDGAMAYSQELESARSASGKRLELEYLVGEVRKQRGMDGMQAWLDSVAHVAPEDGALSYKQSAVAALAESLREERSGPWSEAFVQFMVENGEAPFLTSKLLSETSSGWTPAHTLDRLLKLPEEIGVRRQAVGDEFQEMVNADPEYAEQWLSKQERGPVHDEAIQVYVRETTKKDTTAAMGWAQKIIDPALRDDMIQYVRERGGR